MGKISFEKKKNSISIVNRLSYPEAVNESVLNAIASGMSEHILPVALRATRKDACLECPITGQMALGQYFSGIISKKKFLDVVLQLIRLIKECEKNRLNPSNLDFQADRIFVDPCTGTVRCVYWPVVNNKDSRPPHLFLQQLPSGIRFREQEGTGHTEEYLSFFKGNSPFSINHFEKLILSLQGETIASHYAPSGQIGDGEARTEAAAESHDIDASIEYDPLLSARDVFWDTSGSVADLQYGEPEEEACPYLVREGTGEIIFMDRFPFRMGRSDTECDYVISDNPFVGRNHADILCKGRQYFLADLHSTNKTYVDGREVPPGEAVEVISGTRIMLANEGFVFYMRGGTAHGCKCTG